MTGWFDWFIALVAVIARGIASITGFGIDSLLTPALALETGTKLAVAAIAIPHAVGTALRFWILRRHVDRLALLGFGRRMGVARIRELECFSGVITRFAV